MSIMEELEDCIHSNSFFHDVSAAVCHCQFSFSTDFISACVSQGFPSYWGFSRNFGETESLGKNICLDTEEKWIKKKKNKIC